MNRITPKSLQQTQTLRTLLENSPFKGHDILAVDQFNRENLSYIFKLARIMRDIVDTTGGCDLMMHHVMAAVFYEPSTRTSASFIAAMQRLGGQVIPITQGVQFSSVSKGETLEDTMTTLEQYADLIVLRHPEKGSAKRAANAVSCPIMNAGDGAGEHPTQALLDLFTILEEKGTIDGMTVTMLGDLHYGRTVHSLARLLMDYDVKLRFVSPESLRLPLGLMQDIRDNGFDVRESDKIDTVIGETDILYVTRVQRERLPDAALYDTVKGSYAVTPALMEKAKDNLTLMHPLPRVGEIDPALDTDPRAAYFRQVKNGLYIRMALIAATCTK